MALSNQAQQRVWGGRDAGEQPVPRRRALRLALGGGGDHLDNPVTAPMPNAPHPRRPHGAGSMKGAGRSNGEPPSAQPPLRPPDRRHYRSHPDHVDGATGGPARCSAGFHGSYRPSGLAGRPHGLKRSAGVKMPSAKRWGRQGEHPAGAQPKDPRNHGRPALLYGRTMR